MNRMPRLCQAITTFIAVKYSKFNCIIEFHFDKTNRINRIIINFTFVIGSDIDWKFTTRNESFSCLRNKGVCKWPRGKNLGGTTVHHGMAYHRGNAKDYEKWVKMGNVGWSWDEVILVACKNANYFPSI